MASSCISFAFVRVISGFTEWFRLKRDRVRPIEHLAPADVMKYAVTGGAVELVERPGSPEPARPSKV